MSRVNQPGMADLHSVWSWPKCCHLKHLEFYFYRFNSQSCIGFILKHIHFESKCIFVFTNPLGNCYQHKPESKVWQATKRWYVEPRSQQAGDKLKAVRTSTTAQEHTALFSVCLLKSHVTQLIGFDRTEPRLLHYPLQCISKVLELIQMVSFRLIPYTVLYVTNVEERLLHTFESTLLIIYLNCQHC